MSRDKFGEEEKASAPLPVSRHIIEVLRLLELHSLINSFLDPASIARSRAVSLLLRDNIEEDLVYNANNEEGRFESYSAFAEDLAELDPRLQGLVRNNRYTIHTIQSIKEFQ